VESLSSEKDWADKHGMQIFQQGLLSICESIEKMLRSKDEQLLSACRLVVFHISTIDFVDPQSIFARAWALCPVSANLNDLRVAREDLNGTLALIDLADSTYPLLAYLNMIDNKSGTLLVRADEYGLIPLHLDSPRMSSFQHGGAGEPKTTGDREFKCRVAIDRRPMSSHFGYHP
jgi:hypothetical protein